MNVRNLKSARFCFRRFAQIKDRRRRKQIWNPRFACIPRDPCLRRLRRGNVFSSFAFHYHVVLLNGLNTVEARMFLRIFSSGDRRVAAKGRRGKRGFTAPPERKPAPAKRLSIPCILHCGSTTPFFSLTCILVVPNWCHPPPSVAGQPSSLSSLSHSSNRTRPRPASPICSPIAWYIWRTLLFSKSDNFQ